MRSTKIFSFFAVALALLLTVPVFFFVTGCDSDSKPKEDKIITPDEDLETEDSSDPKKDLPDDEEKEPTDKCRVNYCEFIENSDGDCRINEEGTYRCGCDSGYYWNSIERECRKLTIIPTGQIRCYDDEGEIPCPGRDMPFYGQDASLNMGSMRLFSVGGAYPSEYVDDPITMLRWQRTIPAKPQTHAEAVNYCNTLVYAGEVWRLPTARELSSLINYGDSSPAIDTGFFPDTPASLFHSSTEYDRDSSMNWLVSFGSGVVGVNEKSKDFYVRCVTGTWDYTFGYTDHGDYLTTIPTNLSWTREHYSFQNWIDAINHCNALAVSSKTWFLPTINDLISLSDPQKYGPATDFPETPHDWFVSSTPYHDKDVFAWSLNFNTGGTAPRPVTGGNSSVTIVDEPSGQNCSFGGKKVEVSYAGTVDPSMTKYLCSDGDYDVVVRHCSALGATECPNPEGKCPKGGIKVEAGFDTNSDGVLQDFEVLDRWVFYFCNKYLYARCVSYPDGYERTVTCKSFPEGAIWNKVSNYQQQWNAATGLWNPPYSETHHNPSETTIACHYICDTANLYVWDAVKEECVKVHICNDDETRQIPCGYNGNGLQDQVCIDNQWVNTGPCVGDTDECFEGEETSESCSPPDPGWIAKECIDGKWEYVGVCNSGVSCGNGLMDANEICDINRSTGGAWGDGKITCATWAASTPGVDVSALHFGTSTYATCNTTCSGYDNSKCHWCGDAILDLGEECDVSKSYSGAQLCAKKFGSENAYYSIANATCSESCDISATIEVNCPYCGDGVENGPELNYGGCDDGIFYLPEELCAKKHGASYTYYATSTGSCSGCKYTANCHYCGDGNISGLEVCDTNGPNLGGKTCATLVPAIAPVFSFTGGVQEWVVPNGITSVFVEAWGAQGGDRGTATKGGRGGYASGNLAVTPGETLRIYVGGQNGYNGGGSAGWSGVRGGGASDVRQGGTALANRRIVAGGGGSVGATFNAGGDGGGLSGGVGAGSWGTGGTGGTQSSGGSSGGSLGNGGAGFSSNGGFGGGGGGGYYGGGGVTPDTTCCDDDKGGGGGSSFTGGVGVTGGTTTAGVQTGNGEVRIFAQEALFTAGTLSCNAGCLSFNTSQCTKCGNGIIEPGETCDDGNANNSDGCNSSCQIEDTHTCTGTPSVCKLKAGRCPIGSTCVDNSSFVSQSVNYHMYASGTYSVSVTFKNTGNTAWGAAANYNLGSINDYDNVIWGMNRVGMGASLTQPGENKTFTFTVTAPGTVGGKNFQWRMVHDGVAWFGADSTNYVVYIITAACDTAIAQYYYDFNSEGYPLMHDGWVWDSVNGHLRGGTLNNMMSSHNLGSGAWNNWAAHGHTVNMSACAGQNIRFRWSQKVDTESCCDYVQARVVNTTNTDWDVIYGNFYGFEGWTEKTWDIPDAYKNYVNILFGVRTDGSVLGDGYRIDWVRVERY